MMRTTYEAIQDLLVHLEGSNPPVRAQLITEARRGIEQKHDLRGRLVSENPHSKQEKPNEPAHR
jgi:hypothetical protein